MSSLTTINFHDVVSIEIGRIEHLGGRGETVCRQILLTDSGGNRLDVTTFGTDEGLTLDSERGRKERSAE
jgi:hypothetical protein